MTNLGVETKMISPETFIFFEVTEHPIHPAYFLLTSIQKSDYVRFYIMHLYGGGYSDAKHTHFDWRPYFERLQNDRDHDAYGYAEKLAIDIPCLDSGNEQTSCAKIRSHYSKIIGNGLFIFKRDSPLTREWFRTAT